MRSFFGPQRWWPAASAFEIMIGAILTQNTSWRNVEKAIANLKEARLLTPHRLYNNRRRLESLIRPAGFYRQKARTISAFLKYYIGQARGRVDRLRRRDPARVRGELLAIRGIGPETADAMALYALGHPVFVVDAYTRRVFSRHRTFPGDLPYRRIQQLFEKNLTRSARRFGEFHALLVRLGKTFCKKHDPDCANCPVNHR